jgi:transposase
VNGKVKIQRTKKARAERKQTVRAHRASGLTLRQLAQRFGISLGLAHYLCHDVQVQLPNRWHRNRMPKEAPLPAPAMVHRYLYSK